MKKLMLMCNAGMSTSVLVKKMQKSAALQGIEIDIWAISETDFEKNWRNADAILLGPQVSYMKDKVDQTVGAIPVDVIAIVDYGRMNGEKVLAQGLQLLENK
ncbi:PTS system beta-glucoside-specific, IIB component [Listeria fleischmannii 1991]|uniref:Lichenan-specific phosphotransferase enzyme IIB component n=3 Tax=Listeria fleischmannii TaxID=1069827 RepID=A0A2X3HCU4_9LIST|nr:PTS sugar transporter subunit IIB [Listeria fleischmannii]AEM61145.1 putative PTS component IIB [Listeria fleischmannii subsp. fleischmannii LU2006-1]EMG27997.1 PTS system beta-glucoside-specific, IIB component [Listeria fleischmannii subsp. fleischmannii LU2006-1]KMT57773.1 PTS system beta-glucoside-specific, IIB component [Listeria fleischmannii 1991]SQC70503.1 Lichenan-specific phosphotransferase enzyme IIB component [Listeria fleischmannii subsp. fleischmannii]